MHFSGGQGNSRDFGEHQANESISKHRSNVGGGGGRGGGNASSDEDTQNTESNPEFDEYFQEWAADFLHNEDCSLIPEEDKHTWTASLFPDGDDSGDGTYDGSNYGSYDGPSNCSSDGSDEKSYDGSGDGISDGSDDYHPSGESKSGENESGVILITDADGRIFHQFLTDMSLLEVAREFYSSKGKGFSLFLVLQKRPSRMRRMTGCLISIKNITT